MNDDNLRFVSLARRLRKKIEAGFPHFRLVRPTLKHGPIPRLYGYNYLKMSKRNSNAIFLDLAPWEIDRQLQRLLNRRWLCKQGVEFRIAFEQGGTSVMAPNEHPLVSFYSAFIAKEPTQIAVGDIDDLLPEVAAYCVACTEQYRNGLAIDRGSEQRLLDRMVANESDVSSLIIERLKALG